MYMYQLLYLGLCHILVFVFMLMQMSGLVISALVTVVPLVDCSSAVGSIKMSDVSICTSVYMFSH